MCVIIWCYHVMLSSGMITPPFFVFPGNFTHSKYLSIYEEVDSHIWLCNRSLHMRKILFYFLSVYYCLWFHFCLCFEIMLWFEKCNIYAKSLVSLSTSRCRQLTPREDYNSLSFCPRNVTLLKLWWFPRIYATKQKNHVNTDCHTSSAKHFYLVEEISW